jgi:uncharacterized membrane protein
MLIPFPLAFFYATLVSDLAYWRTGEAFWATASFYLLAAAILTALLAAVAGFTDFVGDRRVRALGDAWQHLIGNLIAVALAILNLILRVGDAAAAIVPTGLLLSAAVGLILVFTGWRGGELVFRHRVGVAERAD